MSILFLLIAPYVLAQSPPVWPPAFSVQFLEKTYDYHAGTTNGTYYYDATIDAERVDRQTGNYDRYCSSVRTSSTSGCTQLIVGGYRYLWWPQDSYCCMCCTYEQGCGPLLQDWLANSTYQGTTTMNGYTVDKWEKSGLQSNYYYDLTDGSETPVELDQVPNDYMSFTVGTYQVGALPSSLFNVPSICTPKSTCPLFSLCTVAK